MIPKVKSQIQQLIILLLSGILFAGLVATFFVYNYGSSGRYIAKNILLAPNVIETLDYNDINPKTNARDRYVFQKIEFEYFLPADRQWHKNQIDISTYTKIYDLLSSDKSVEEVTPNLENLFIPKPARFILSVKTNSNAAWQEDSKVFQEIQFEGSEYRVQLHENNPGTHWVYFLHHNIYSKILEILSSSTL
jgi:hypothetical protein